SRCWSAWRPSGTPRGCRARERRSCAGRPQPATREKQRSYSWVSLLEEDEVERRVQVLGLGVGHQLRVHGLHEVSPAQMEQVVGVRLDQESFEFGEGKAWEIRLPLAGSPQRGDEHLVAVKPILGQAVGSQGAYGPGKGSQVERLG